MRAAICNVRSAVEPPAPQVMSQNVGLRAAILSCLSKRLSTPYIVMLWESDRTNTNSGFFSLPAAVSTSSTRTKAAKSWPKGARIYKADRILEALNAHLAGLRRKELEGVEGRTLGNAVVHLVDDLHDVRPSVHCTRARVGPSGLN